MLKTILINCFLSLSILAQGKVISAAFGDFSSASSLSINPLGFIYVTDESLNEIFKYDTLGNLIKSIGGYGWDENQFDCPSDVFTNTLKVYVADKNNNRIVLYDKDLNYISQLSSDEIQDANYSFGYPISCGVSNQGDFFILDSDNSRILKFDLNGKFLTEIGGADAGDFSLIEPVALSVTSSGKLFVAEKKKVLVFDQYGNGLYKFSTKEEIQNLNSSENFLLVIFPKKLNIYTVAPTTELLNSYDFKKEKLELKDAFIFKHKIYFLTTTKIFVLPFKTD